MEAESKPDSSIFREIEAQGETEGTSHKKKNCGPLVKKHGECEFKVQITIPVPIREYTARIKEFLTHIAKAKDRYRLTVLNGVM